MDSATDRQETATRQKALAGQAKTATQGMETESKELEASTAESAKQAQNSEVAAAGSMYKASDMSRTAVGDLEKSQVGADETSEDMYAAQGSANIAGERSEKSKESFAASEGASTLATMTAARAHTEINIAKNRETEAQGAATNTIDRATTASSVTNRAQSRAQEAAADMITNSKNYGMAEDRRRATEGSQTEAGTPRAWRRPRPAPRRGRRGRRRRP